MSRLEQGGVLFVLGATGLTGRSLVAHAAREGYRVHAHVRPGSDGDTKADALRPMGADVDRTPWEVEAMTETLRRLRPDALFLLLGTTRRRAREAAGAGRDEGYMAVDYGLTALAIDAARDAEIRPVVVYLSSAGAEGGRGAYLAARARCEEKLVASGLPYRIARPSFIVGDRPGEPRTSERIGVPLADAALSLAGALGAKRLRARYRSTTGELLAAALLRLAAREGDRVYESEELR